MNKEKFVEGLKVVTGAAEALLQAELSPATIDPLLQEMYRGIALIHNAQREGLRVRVLGGAGEREIGRGILVDHVTVYARYEDEGGALKSPEFAEIPTEGFFPIGNNPKILLDDGRTVYGCQVWWQPLEEEPTTTH